MRALLGSSSDHLSIGRNALENVWSKTGKEAMPPCLSLPGYTQEKRGSVGSQTAPKLAANGHFNPEKSRNVPEELCCLSLSEWRWAVC